MAIGQDLLRARMIQMNRRRSSVGIASSLIGGIILKVFIFAFPHQKVGATCEHVTPFIWPDCSRCSKGFAAEIEPRRFDTRTGHQRSKRL
jgi:hypothetical protein